MGSEFEPKLTQADIHEFIKSELALHQLSVDAAKSQTINSFFSLCATAVAVTGGYFTYRRWQKYPGKAAADSNVAMIEEVPNEEKTIICTIRDRNDASEKVKLGKDRFIKAGALVSVSMLCAAARLTSWKMSGY